MFAYETALRPTTLDLLQWSGVTLAGLHIRAEVDKNRWPRVVPFRNVPARPLLPSNAERPTRRCSENTTTGRYSPPALGDGRGKYVTPYDLKHARVTAWQDEGASVLGVIGWHPGAAGVVDSCEGEDLNLHGSYPASTSS